MRSFVEALFSAVCWGIAPAFGKAGLRGIHPLDGIAARTLITAILIGILTLAGGGFSRLKTIPASGWSFLALESFFATFAGDIAYYAAIKRGEIGLTALILATSPLFTLWMGCYFFGENLSLTKIIGAAFIVIGVILIGVNIPLK